MIPVMSTTLRMTSWLFHFIFGAKEQYAIFCCVISQCHKHSMHVSNLTEITITRNLGFLDYMCVDSSSVSAEWPQIANLCKFSSRMGLFLRWPAYLLMLATRFSTDGQSVGSFTSQLKCEFMFDSIATIGSVKCILGSSHISRCTCVSRQ